MDLKLYTRVPPQAITQLLVGMHCIQTQQQAVTIQLMGIERCIQTQQVLSNIATGPNALYSNTTGSKNVSYWNVQALQF
jgi:hypothetical protein